MYELGHARDQIASIARARELGLLAAKKTGTILSDLDFGDPNAGVRSEDLREFKEGIVAKLINLAEAEYLAQVRKLAMSLMEHDRGLTADRAFAVIESMILEAVVGVA